MLSIEEKQVLARKLGFKTFWEVNVLVDGFRKLNEKEAKYIYSHLLNGYFGENTLPPSED